MGAVIATVGLLGDAVTSAQKLVGIFFYVYYILIFAYILTSWIRLPLSFARLQRFLYDVCEPYLRLFRRFVPPIGAFDLSPVVALIVLAGVQVIVIKVLDQLH